MSGGITRDPGWAPSGRYRRVEDIDPSQHPEFEVALGELLYACRFQMRTGADRLFVMLRSSRGKPFAPVPVFDVEYTPAEMKGHVLAVSDPALFLDAEMEVGTFYGTRRQDAVLDLIGIAERVAGLLRLDRTRIVYWGFSGAAMGAAMAAVKSGTVAVAVNPHLEGANMSGSHIAARIAAVFGAEAADDMNNEFPLRTSVSAALVAANAAGLKPRLLIVMNTNDIAFYKRQFVPFSEQLGIPLDGGADPTGRIVSVVYTAPSGHERETDEIRRHVLTDVLPVLLDDGAAARSAVQAFDAELTSVGTHGFRIPPGVAVVRLLSPATRLGIDPRMLGAAIGGIVLDGRAIPLADLMRVHGFHDVEGSDEHPYRWTNGGAEIPVPPSDSATTLQITVIALSSTYRAAEPARTGLFNFWRRAKRP